MGHKNDLISVNTPIFESRNLAVLRTEPNGDTTAVNVLQKLIVVKDTEKNLEGAYLMTLIPDASFCSYPEKMDIDLFINSGDKGEYSGWVVYTVAMTSRIVRLDYYQNGVKQQAYHTFGTKDENREAIKKIYAILSDMIFGIIPNTTRVIDFNQTFPIEQIIIICPPVVEEEEEEETGGPEITIEELIGPGVPGGGGGGSSGGKPDPGKGPNTNPGDNSGPPEEKLSAKEQLKQDLQDILDKITNPDLTNLILKALYNPKFNFAELPGINSLRINYTPSSDGKIASINAIYYNPTYYNNTSQMGRILGLLHEITHPYLRSLGFSSADHHKQMLTNNVYDSALRELFPGYKDSEYRWMKYAFCNDVLFKDIPLNEEAIRNIPNDENWMNNFLLENGITFLEPEE